MSIFGAQPGWDWCSLLAYGTVLDDGEPLDSPRVFDAAGPGAAVMFHGIYEAGPEMLDSVEGGPEWRAAVEAFPERERHLHTHEQHFVAMTDRDVAAVTGDLIGATTWTLRLPSCVSAWPTWQRAGSRSSCTHRWDPTSRVQLRAMRRFVGLTQRVVPTGQVDRS